MTKVKEKVKELIANSKTSFISSVDQDGFPNMKAMLAPRKVKGLKEFWFSTNTSSLRVSQFRKNPKASIYFYERGHIVYKGVMLTGTMEVLEDQPTKDMIWRFGDHIYYHKGKTDPDYCVLKFTATSARYYNSLHSESFKI